VNPGFKSVQSARMSAAVRLMHCIEQVIRGINVPKWSIIPRYARLFPRTSVARRRLAIIVGTRPAAESIAECLRKCGVEARISPSAVELFEHGRDFKPDLIVSDLALGDISAIEAGCQIRKLVPNCAVLFYSGAVFNPFLDAQSQISAGNALLRLAANAACTEQMFLITA